jgi:hypothetical protein
MTDYFSPTVIQQTIPDADISPLECLLLSQIFDAEPNGDGWYFHSWQGPSDIIWVNRAELIAALEASQGYQSEANVLVEKSLMEIQVENGEVALDLSDTSWEFFIRDIVRRSPTLRYVTVVTAFTCSKMRPDGFGGMALFITADAIRGQSTHEFLADCLAEIAADPSDGLNAGQGFSTRPKSDDGDDTNH